MDARRRNSVSTVLNLALVTGVLVVATDSGLAQEKKKVSWSTKPENTKITVQQALEIPDTAGHVMRITEYRRTWPDGGGPVVEGHKVVEEIARVFSDMIAGNGHGSGYSTWRFENGDLMFGQFQNSYRRS